MDIWMEKLAGLLHDPPYKFLNIRKHKDAVNEIFGSIGLGKEHSISEDWEASAMDRFLFPREKSQCSENGRICESFTGKKSKWIHTLSGEKSEEIFKNFLSDSNASNAFDEAHEHFMRGMVNEVKDYRTNEGHLDYKRMFLKIWWDLPWFVRNEFGTELVPAETRMPNHSILDHLFATSSLCGLKDPAFISFSIGPVQSFIASARKTTDLWVGSYLLSDLSWECMKTVAEEFGPDSIVFPDLHKQKRVKEWIEEKGANLRDDDCLEEFLPSLPNKFTAIVEYSQAEKLAEKVRENLLSKWKNLCEQAKEYYGLQGEKAELWDKQVLTFPEFYYSVYRWPKSVEELSKEYEKIFGKKSEEIVAMHKLLETKVNGTEYFKTTYTEKVGQYYGIIFEIARRKFDAVKMTTPINPYEGINGIDNDVISGTFESIIKDDEDSLNALDAVKRYCVKGPYSEVVEKYFKKLNFKGERIPSTTDIAAGMLLKEKPSQKMRKVAVLVMDGDSMGKWISGKKAPLWRETFTDSVKSHKTFKEYMDDDFLNRKRSVFPAFHRAISRALTNFTSYVYNIVASHGGLLVYAGGDDVLALLPSFEVMECANELRKVFRGHGITVNGTKFENGFVYENGKPVYQLMGTKASMSAGISVGNHKYPLSELMKMAHMAESDAKEKRGRNAFALRTIRRSGQIVDSGSKWDAGFDVLNEAKEILERFGSKDLKNAEDEAISKKVIKMLSQRRMYFGETHEEDFEIDMKIVLDNGKEDFQKYMEYILKRRLDVKEEAKVLAQKFTNFVLANEKMDEHENILRRATLLNEMMFIKRGEEREFD